MDLFTLFIIIVVVGSRLLVPLLIPRYPLPAILASLIIDAVDQTVFQTFTDLELKGYQNYDKALDIYYLSIAYLSTLRNWTNRAAFQISQFLFYYRMFGNALFEITQIRMILFIFPNTFEYFFIFVSGTALFYKMKRLSIRLLLAVAAFIWIFIKFPQEYWIHIAKLDTTDLFKEKILNVPLETSWTTAFAQNIWVFPAFAIIFLAIGVILFKIIKILPKPDHKLNFGIDISEKLTPTGITGTFIRNILLRKRDFAEKIFFVSLITIIFSHVFPSFQAGTSDLILGVSFVILANAVVSYALIKYSKFKVDILNKFNFILIVNVVIAYAFAIFLAGDRNVNYFVIFFLAYLLTLITILYDRFKPYFVARFK